MEKIVMVREAHFVFIMCSFWLFVGQHLGTHYTVVGAAAPGFRPLDHDCCLATQCLLECVC